MKNAHRFLTSNFNGTRIINHHEGDDRSIQVNVSRERENNHLEGEGGGRAGHEMKRKKESFIECH